MFSFIIRLHLAGFARAITDYATFAYLSDLFVVPTYRDKGLGKMLVAQIVQYPTLQNLQSFLFAISDTQGLYENYEDFEP